MVEEHPGPLFRRVTPPSSPGAGLAVATPPPPRRPAAPPGPPQVAKRQEIDPARPVPPPSAPVREPAPRPAPAPVLARTLTATAAPELVAAPALAAPVPAKGDPLPDPLPDPFRDPLPDPLIVALRRWFGFDDFRPGQRETIEAVLAGQDALAVLPTGAGKSLTYLLPGLLLPGVTLVVSPLIALMQDQLDKLRARGLPAAVINSQLGWQEQKEALRALREGRLKVLLVAPERFRNERFLQALEGVRVSLLAVDEAHCVSQWGHDFRPDYLRLGEIAQTVGRPPVLAVTATATRQVREDIGRQLGLRADVRVVVRGLDRPNLALSVHEVGGGREAKLRALSALLARVPAGGAGIVYCATRKNADLVARELRARGRRKLGVYHAGMRDEERRRVQERFFAGELELVVATNAFGLGIDKQDLRFVFHYDLPGSLEAYVQEAGRAGRDGRPARCALLFAAQDLHLQRFFIESGHPQQALVEEVARAAARVGPDPDAIERRLTRKASGRAIETALRLLEQAEGRVEAVDFARVRARAAHEEELLRRLLRYCRGQVCRRRSILAYFGAPEAALDPRAERCDSCDVCVPALAQGLAAPRGAVGAAGAGAAGERRRPRASRARRERTGDDPRPSRARRSRKDDEEIIPAANSSLVERLRELRRRISKKERLPAYRVLHDKTLEDLARRRPTTRAALLEVHGIGEAKLARYGDQLLSVLRAGS